MLIPETYGAALCLMILTMLCWGSWANTLKLCPGYRFQLFYWDYVIGMALGAVLWGFTAGSMGHAGLPFLADLRQTAMGPMLYAMIGGAIFNVANLLLVAAIDVAGLAVAFPVGIGLALVIGAISNYVDQAGGQSPAAVRRRGAGGGGDCARCGGISRARGDGEISDRARHRDQPCVRRADGLLLSICGASAEWRSGAGHAPGPYAVTLFFMIGLLISTVPANLLLMKKPLDGSSASGRRRLWPRADGLAPGGRSGRSDLVHRRRRELSCIGRAPGRAGGLL